MITKFYFAGSIRGGREKVDTFIKINELLEKHGEVLDKHVANPNVGQLEQNLTETEIYKRDIAWLNECDIVVAEVTTPSLGVGYEIAYAEKLGKKIICLYDKSINLSAMIRGDENLKVIPYETDEELLGELENALKTN